MRALSIEVLLRVVSILCWIAVCFLLLRRRHLPLPVNRLGGLAYAANLQATTEEGRIMSYVVKATHPDVRYSIELPKLVDAEDNPISNSDLAVRDVQSDNPDAVTITPDNDAGLAGTVHFGKSNADGSPAEANVTAKVINVRTGEQVGTLSDHFTIPPGDPAKFLGGGFVFADLNKEPEAPAPSAGEAGDGTATTEAPAA